MMMHATHTGCVQGQKTEETQEQALHEDLAAPQKTPSPNTIRRIAQQRIRYRAQTAVVRKKQARVSDDYIRTIAYVKHKCFAIKHGYVTPENLWEELNPHMAVAMKVRSGFLVVVLMVMYQLCPEDVDVGLSLEEYLEQAGALTPTSWMVPYAQELMDLLAFLEYEREGLWAPTIEALSPWCKDIGVKAWVPSVWAGDDQPELPARSGVILGYFDEVMREIGHAVDGEGKVVPVSTPPAVEHYKEVSIPPNNIS